MSLVSLQVIADCQDHGSSAEPFLLASVLIRTKALAERVALMELLTSVSFAPMSKILLSPVPEDTKTILQAYHQVFDK